MKLCTICNREFRGARVDAKYCSSTCRNRKRRGTPMESAADIPVVEAGVLVAPKVLRPLRVVHNKDTDAVCSPNEDSSPEERKVMVKITDHYISNS